MDRRPIGRLDVLESYRRTLNPRVRGSSPWRRTRDQGSDLVVLPGSEPFSCPLWTVVCSMCAPEPMDSSGRWQTGRTRWHCGPGRDTGCWPSVRVEGRGHGRVMDRLGATGLAAERGTLRYGADL